MILCAFGFSKEKILRHTNTKKKKIICMNQSGVFETQDFSKWT